MQELKPIKEGKVREIYDNGDSLIMVATDRISCFDVILNNEVTKKGAVLTQMSKFWFDMTEDILPNHMISVDTKDMPEFFQQEKFEGKSMMCRKLNMLPIECIVRGYITGSGWASYKENGTVCGIKLPEGLKESDKLPEPIYTPSTKAEIGDHDENISFEQSVTHLEKYFPGRGQELAEKLRDNTIALYKKCAEYALSKGIIIADTKFEFGLDEDGNMVNGDQIMGILARAKKHAGKLNHDTLVVTVMSNLGLKLALRSMGIKTVQTNVGDRYVLEEMLRGDYSLGGEQSGHVINREFATTGDGTLTALTLCNEVVKSGKSLKELAADFPQLPQTLINVPNVDKKAASTNKRIQDAVAREEELLGDTGRVLLRPSGTEPLVRVMAEAATQAYADEVCTRLAKIVAEELAL